MGPSHTYKSQRKGKEPCNFLYYISFDPRSDAVKTNIYRVG